MPCSIRRITDNRSPQFTAYLQMKIKRKLQPVKSGLLIEGCFYAIVYTGGVEFYEPSSTKNEIKNPTTY